MNIFSKKKTSLGLLVIVAVFLVVGIVWAYNQGTNISVTTSSVDQPACYSGAYPTPTLNWVIGSEAVPPASWPASSQVRYDIQIDDDSNFGSIDIDTGQVTSGDNFYTVNESGLSFGTGYYWRIRVRDNFNSWTDMVQGLDTLFTTAGQCNNPPDRPDSNGPGGSSTLDRSPGDYCVVPAYYFSWTYSDSDSDDQSRFQFQVDNNNDFSSPEIDRDYTGLSNPSPAANNQTVVIAVSPSSDQIGYNDTYYWRVKVYDSEGADSGWAEGNNFVAAQHQYPTIDFSWSPLSPSIDESTLFTDLSTVYGGATKSSWSWTFTNGNPSSSSQQNPTVQFASSGNKQVTLQITDSDGYSCIDSKTTTIQAELPDWQEK